MVIDSSAVVAILLEEPEALAFALSIQAAPAVRMSAASVLETVIVLRGRPGADAKAVDVAVDGLIENGGIVVEPVTIDQLAAARDAHQRFGKGRHPAALNFGDCFTYALAATHDAPLLFKGDDFSRTDLRPALMV